ncbi:MAG: hypothetical protein AAF487_12850 [Bacteroidota bacterium]
MKNYIFAITLSLSAIQVQAQESRITIPANQSMEIDYPQYELYEVTLKNKSLKGISVAVLSKENKEQIRGFGLGTKGDVDVLVEAENKLVLANDNNSPVSLSLKIRETQIEKVEKTTEYISFTLRNNGAKSIPLIIPSVMNPNLSPFSNSGVDLKIGQKILFKQNGKKHLLLEVDRSIKNGDVINVGDLLKERKKELGLK